jgi:hypothetical protein
MPTNVQNAKQQPVKSLIYFKVGEERIYLLVKPKAKLDPKPTFELPEFKLELEPEICPTRKMALCNNVCDLIESEFAISQREIVSMTVEESDEKVYIQIEEESVIVLSDNYLDYTWEGEK